MAKTISFLVDVHDYICIDGDKILPHVTFFPKKPPRDYYARLKCLLQVLLRT